RGIARSCRHRHGAERIEQQSRQAEGSTDSIGPHRQPARDRGGGCVPVLGRCVLHHRPHAERERRNVFPVSKTLLIVSGSIEAAEAARKAREMGLYVVVSDRNPEAPSFAFADSCLIADVYGADETAAAAERFSRKIRKIDAVICVAADAPK